MFRKICNLLLALLFIILLAVSGLLLIPRFLGYKTMAVVSGSMEPAISVGSTVYAKAVAIEDLAEGDVISFRAGDDTIITHRVQAIDRENNRISTKGDANSSIDGDPVSISAVVGKVMLTIPYLGYLGMYIKTPIGIAIICGVVLLLVLLLYLPDLVWLLQSRKGQHHESPQLPKDR